jgi:hypothetical protein
VSDDRIPWWGLLVELPLDRATAEIEACLPSRFKEDDYALAAGRGWTAFHCYLKTAVDFAFGAKLRARGHQVILLDYGDEQWVHRWDGRSWAHDEERPRDLETSLGIAAPWRGDDDVRPFREAVLIAGRTRDQVLRDFPDLDRVETAARGAVAFGEAASLVSYDDPAVTTFDATHFLDNGEFVVTITCGDRVTCFAKPAQTGSMFPAIADVEGETDPRKILRKLGIPEDFMFPSKR